MSKHRSRFARTRPIAVAERIARIGSIFRIKGISRINGTVRQSHFLLAFLTSLSLTFFLYLGMPYPHPAFSGMESPVLDAMTRELGRCYGEFSKQPVPLYFLSYQITDIDSRWITASCGAINQNSSDHSRYLDVDARVGSPSLDNTHEIRGGFEPYSPTSWIRISLEDNQQAIRQRLWLETEKGFRSAVERYTKVLTDRAVKVEEEDRSDDFSREAPETYFGARAAVRFDTELWQDRLRRLSSNFIRYPEIFRSNVSLSLSSTNKYLVNSEGTRIQEGNNRVRLSLYCETTAEDGMNLRRYRDFNAEAVEGLPTDDRIASEIQSMIEELLALRAAPLVEPYAGPAILVNRATGVFFHEIFGHRVEGHRQKSESEGQTFTKSLGQAILPDFISICDDPTRKEFKGRALSGYYKYDDEGVKAQRVDVVKNGVLESFLLSRSPIRGFPKSNGHGRREHSHSVVARQGNLIITSEETVPYDRLRELLIEECKKQSKPYGLVFKDAEWGQTWTGREGPQSFKVYPHVVYRVYADGRPDQLVRGVDIVGTPIASLAKITMAGDDYDIFDGYCGAESGSVPVSCVAPSLLVSEIEVQKKVKEQDRPPVLPAPSQQ